MCGIKSGRNAGVKLALTCVWFNLAESTQHTTSSSARVQVVCCECKLAPHDCAPHDQAEAAPKSGSAADTISILIFDASTARVWSGIYFASAQIDQQPCCGIALGEKQTHGEGPIIRGNFRLSSYCVFARALSFSPPVYGSIYWMGKHSGTIF